MDATVAFNPQHLVPDRHHGAAGRRHLGLGADARRGAAGADLRLPLRDCAQLFQRRAGPGAAGHRVLHPERPDRPCCGPTALCACPAAARRRICACARPTTAIARRPGSTPGASRPCAASAGQASAEQSADEASHDARCLPLLEVSRASVATSAASPRLDGVSFTVARGEVVSA